MPRGRPRTKDTQLAKQQRRASANYRMRKKLKLILSCLYDIEMSVGGA